MSDPRAVDAVASLADPQRRRLYDLVAAAPDGLTRDGAAAQAGVPRHVAAYHLDQLAVAGLVEVEHRRPAGRRGPGAGRPAKVYRRAARGVHVSFPPRNDRLAARVLLAAAGAVDAPPAGQIDDVALRVGRALGEAARERGDDLVEVLTANGFEPFHDGAEIRLRNCPFHELAGSDRDTVCAMNLALLRGVAAGLRLRDLRAQRAPSGGCCVAFRNTT